MLHVSNDCKQARLRLCVLTCMMHDQKLEALAETLAELLELHTGQHHKIGLDLRLEFYIDEQTFFTMKLQGR